MVAFKRFSLHPLTIGAFVFLILLHIVALPRKIGATPTPDFFISEMINYAIGLIILFLVVLLFLTAVYVMSGYRKDEVNSGNVMTDTQCLAAIEETMQSISDYADVTTSAKAGDKDAQQKAWSDDQFMQELQANILNTTGAQMSLEETRRYFSEWYFTQKEN